MSPLRCARLLGMVAALAGLTAGCTTVIAGTPIAGERIAAVKIDTAFIEGTDGGRMDQLAAGAVIDVQAYWRQTFQGTFGASWRDVSAFHSVDSNNDDAKAPPCADDTAEVEGNAFYCPSADAIAWDRAALLPVLADRFGDAGVVVVLAHEIGHAVHNRLGIDSRRQRQNGDRYPTIVVEAMADCYAGAFVRWVVDGKAEHVRIGAEQLDLALSALVTFRDPVGTSSRDRGAHGNAFDRVSSFSDGYQHGPKLCSEFTAQTRQFTLRAFTSLDDETSAGNMPLLELLQSLTPDVDRYFTEFVRQRGGTWATPELRLGVDEAACSGDQGPVAYCPEQQSVGTDDDAGALVQVHDEIGDFAAGTLVTSRYALAALATLGKPTDGEAAGHAALCLAGGYTGQLLNRTDDGFGLSPGDLDEAVMVLLRSDFASRDASGRPAPGTGFDRVGHFRGGALEGAGACRLG